MAGIPIATLPPQSVFSRIAELRKMIAQSKMLSGDKGRAYRTLDDIERWCREHGDV
jgi:hypothetical protein